MLCKHIIKIASGHSSVVLFARQTLINSLTAASHSLDLRADSVADRVLRFDREKEARSEGIEIENARIPATLWLLFRQVSLLKVTVRECDEPPDDSEEEPAENEAVAKDQEGPAPLRVDKCRKDVLQEAQSLLRQLGLDNVAFTVLQDRSLAILLGCKEKQIEDQRS